ncbi:MAG: tRNA pseudouridine(55) synthase TruB, partial [Actinomycetia bacterium]|nr:tRNA pseudouridine(55) synthase TruB [Actinomycetes bacterium]
MGHSGTLDPLASGLMIVLINKATKLSDAFLKLPKEYMAKIQFGIETDTLDIEGKIISQKDAAGLSINNINKVLDRFKGPVKQIPPMYSAIKHNG